MNNQVNYGVNLPDVCIKLYTSFFSDTPVYGVELMAYIQEMTASTGEIIILERVR